MISTGWDKHVRMWNLAGRSAPDEGRRSRPFPTTGMSFASRRLPTGNTWPRPGCEGSRSGPESAESGMADGRGGERRTGYRCVAAAADGRTLALGGLRRHGPTLGPATRKETQVLRGFVDDVRVGPVLPGRCNTWLPSTFSGEFQLWKLRPGAPPLPIKRQVELVQSFQFSPDNQTLALARWGDDSKELDPLGLPEPGTNACSWLDNARGINDLAVSPDGRILASADRDRSIRFWDMQTGSSRRRIVDGVGWVKTLAYAPDGRRIAFGGKRGSRAIA